MERPQGKKFNITSKIVRLEVDPTIQRERMRRWRSNPENVKKERERSRKRYYEKKSTQDDVSFKSCCHSKRITVDEYNEMFINQSGSCSICGVHSSELTKRLYIDHNHETGKVRGLLCQKCNSGLGLFRDSLSLLQEAVRYMEDNDGKL